jgi:hypothetical protein
MGDTGAKGILPSPPTTCHRSRTFGPRRCAAGQNGPLCHLVGSAPLLATNCSRTTWGVIRHGGNQRRIQTVRTASSNAQGLRTTSSINAICTRRLTSCTSICTPGPATATKRGNLRMAQATGTLRALFPGGIVLVLCYSLTRVGAASTCANRAIFPCGCMNNVPMSFRYLRTGGRANRPAISAAKHSVVTEQRRNSNPV